MVIKVQKEVIRKDSNGKQYKFLTLYTPEYAEISSLTDQLTVRSSKTCGFVTYPVDYTNHQSSDPGSSLSEGDEVPGYVMSVRVVPYFIGKDLITKCSVPVFQTKDDPIEFEIALERAVERAGKVIDPRELNYGTEDKYPQEVVIPKNCLIVKTV